MWGAVFLDMAVRTLTLVLAEPELGLGSSTAKKKRWLPHKTSMLGLITVTNSSEYIGRPSQRDPTDPPRPHHVTPNRD